MADLTPKELDALQEIQDVLGRDPRDEGIAHIRRESLLRLIAQARRSGEAERRCRDLQDAFDCSYARETAYRSDLVKSVKETLRERLRANAIERERDALAEALGPFALYAKPDLVGRDDFTTAVVSKGHQSLLVGAFQLAHDAYAAVLTRHAAEGEGEADAHEDV